MSWVAFSTSSFQTLFMELEALIQPMVVAGISQHSLKNPQCLSQALAQWWSFCTYCWQKILMCFNHFTLLLPGLEVATGLPEAHEAVVKVCVLHEANTEAPVGCLGIRQARKVRLSCILRVLME